MLHDADRRSATCAALNLGCQRCTCEGRDTLNYTLSYDSRDGVVPAAVHLRHAGGLCAGGQVHVQVERLGGLDVRHAVNVGLFGDRQRLHLRRELHTIQP